MEPSSIPSPAPTSPFLTSVSLTAAVKIAGITASAFGPEEQGVFKAAIAGVFEYAKEEDVRIKSAVDVARNETTAFMQRGAPTPGTRRRLQATSVLINEVHPTGAYGGGTCGSWGGIWVELANPTAASVNLAGYTLRDDDGGLDYVFPSSPADILTPGGFLVLCKFERFQFSIGPAETLALIDAGGNAVSATTLGGTSSVDTTWARDPLDGTYSYTRLPTGGAANEFPPNVVVSEVADLGSSGIAAASRGSS
jgi:hypothetical protein